MMIYPSVNMKKLIQTRLHIPKKQTGNCFPTVIACILDLDDPEDVVQFQEHYRSKDGWAHILIDWLEEKGYEWSSIKGHLFDGSYYLVTGHTKRSKKTTHVCIYQNGKLYHDPHPDQSGLIDELDFHIITKINNPSIHRKPFHELPP